MSTNRIVFICLLSVSLFSCSKTPTEVAVGSIEGYVLLMDQYAYPVKENAGVQVSIESVSFSTVTDKDGRYLIPDLPEGSYRITYTASGYGVYSSRVEFSGSGQRMLERVVLNPFADFVVDSAECYIDRYDQVVAFGTISAPNPYEIRFVAIFATTELSRLPRFNSSEFVGTGWIAQGHTNFIERIVPQQRKQFGSDIPSGTQFRVLICPITRLDSVWNEMTGDCNYINVRKSGSQELVVTAD